MESLGHGSYLIIDGLGSQSTTLSLENAKSFLSDLASQLEPIVQPQFTVAQLESKEEGYSVLMQLPESHIALHLFPACQALSLRVFSRYDISLESFTTALKEQFSLNRVSSHLSNHCRTLSSKADRRLRGLQGDRNYTSVRLNKSLLF
ncbi:MAG: S-adenosylmethionine decarboxylase [Trueperaceae bacterium]|nr:S-adenosylmethionine decarboxylase [Trueperaceae bacterium]